MPLFRIVALLLLLGLHKAQAQTHTRLLDKADWKFKKPSETSWLPATVPGTVHTDLFANKIIPDPFYGDHESRLQWIESENWEYQSSFNLSADELKIPISNFNSTVWILMPKCTLTIRFCCKPIICLELGKQRLNVF
jgi:hypothetical protein